MKATRLVLFGLGTLVLSLVAWLQHDSNPQLSPPPSGSGRHNAATPDPQEPAVSGTESSKAGSRDEGPARALPTTVSPAEIFSLPRGFERQQLVERYGFDAAKENLTAALQILSGITVPSDRQAFLRGMFSRAAEGNRIDAVTAVKALTEVLDRETALTALVATWRPKPIPIAGQYSLTERFGSMGGILAQLLDDPTLAVNCANELLSGMEKARFLASAAQNEAVKDPQRALSFGSSLTGNEQREFLIGFASGWASSAGEAAWTWSLQEGDSAFRQTLQASILQSWARRDPETAASHLGSITDVEARYKAVAAIGAAWAGADTQAAFAWANSLPNQQEQDAAKSAITSEAPVGIGVVLQSGPEGYPLVTQLVPGGPASLAGGLKDGYTIAAISNGSGGFTDLQGKSLTDVTSMIRGKSGSTVWLQVVEPGGRATDRRTIAVPRQQLMFKRAPGDLMSQRLK